MDAGLVWAIGFDTIREHEAATSCVRVEGSSPSALRDLNGARRVHFKGR
jgi:hypothetical protein